MTNDDLNGLRARLDEIDKQIVQLLIERMVVAEDVGKVKEQAEYEDFGDPAREAQVIRRVQDLAGDHLPAAFIDSLYRNIMAEALRRQRPMRVSYLGPIGTFSHEAALNHFGVAAEFQPEDSIRACFEAVAYQRSNRTIVPYENSTEGGVGETLDCLTDTKLIACGEAQLRIRQHLLALPGTKLAAITAVYSHPQSFAQCRRWLDAKLPTCERIVCSSNSAAAKQVADAGGGCAAVLGSHGLAAIHGFAELARNIEDNPNNVTRFLVLGRQLTGPTDDDKTTVVVAARDRPGSLFGLLKLFADAGLNMTRLESRPLRGEEIGKYLFFIDVLGHQDEANLAEVLERLAAEAASCKVVGSYPRSAIVG